MRPSLIGFAWSVYRILCRIFIVNFDWQLGVVLLCMVWAVAVIGRYGYQLFSPAPSKGCGSGGCHGCLSNSTSPATGLVQLGAPKSVQK